MAESHIAKQTADKPCRAPLFHIVKRNVMPWYKAWAVRAIAILASFVLMGLVSLLVLHENPFRVFGTMFSGAFRYPKRTWRLFYDTAMLLLIALALTPAFRMRFWNIGAEGQVLIGGLCSFLCMKYLADLPNALLLLIMLVAGMAGGVIWTAIPAFFKAKWGTNETLFTLMMNYVATCLVAFSIQAMYPKGTGTVGILNPDTQAGWLPKLGNGDGANFILTILVAVLLTCFVYVYMRYSKQGYEISVVGESENTARYIGINVRKVILRTMILTGALCGLVGFLLVGGPNHSIEANSVGGNGFTAIMVAWLAKFNPVFMLFASFLICFLRTGSGQVTSDFSIDSSYGDILIGIVLFFIIGCEFFINYQVCFRKKQKEA